MNGVAHKNYKEFLESVYGDPHVCGVKWVKPPAYVAPWGTKPVAFQPIEPQYATESEKPIGTRNPDKFLKEQQDKLWQEMM